MTLVAVVGCNQADKPASPTSGPSASAATASQGPAGASAIADPGQASAPAASYTISASGSGAATTPAPPPTPDAVASELDQISQLINDINDSLSSSDSAGGE